MFVIIFSLACVILGISGITQETHQIHRRSFATGGWCVLLQGNPFCIILPYSIDPEQDFPLPTQIAGGYTLLVLPLVVGSWRGTKHGLSMGSIRLIPFIDPFLSNICTCGVFCCQVRLPDQKSVYNIYMICVPTNPKDKFNLFTGDSRVVHGCFTVVDGPFTGCGQL